jgi:hypothetical protein
MIKAFAISILMVFSTACMTDTGPAQPNDVTANATDNDGSATSADVARDDGAADGVAQDELPGDGTAEASCPVFCDVHGSSPPCCAGQYCLRQSLAYGLCKPNL